jgi:hypothetical protein
VEAVVASAKVGRGRSSIFATSTAAAVTVEIHSNEEDFDAIDVWEAVVAAALPAAAVRGGDHGNGTLSGTFALDLNVAPSYADDVSGFRCVVPR